jgi:hypothetical protein
MPVRFRCYFCLQKLSISQRKAGTVTECPRCHGQVWVPDPDAMDEEEPAAELPGDVILTSIPEPARPTGTVLWLSRRQIHLLLVALILVLVLLFGAGVWVGRSFRPAA